MIRHWLALMIMPTGFDFGLAVATAATERQRREF